MYLVGGRGSVSGEGGCMELKAGGVTGPMDGRLGVRGGLVRWLD